MRECCEVASDGPPSPTFPQNFYLVGHDKCKEHWRILKIDRREPSELVIHEDAIIYTEQMCKGSLAQLAEGNRSSGGLQLVTKAYGIIGQSDSTTMPFFVTKS